MPDEKDVTVGSSPAQGQEPEQVVEEGGQPAPQETETQTVRIKEVEPVDERGIPISSVESEWKRKYEQLLETQKENIHQAVTSAFEAQKANATPQWSEEQLALVIDDDTGTYTAANKAWARVELARKQQKAVVDLVEQKLNVSQEQQQKVRTKAEAERYVINTFPEMFTKDQVGNVTWNIQNPMTQLVARYMAVPEIKNRPDAIREATRQAYVDYQLSMKGKQMQQSQLQASQVAQLKKQNLTGGTGKINESSSTSAEVNAAYEKFRKSGDPKDALAYKRLMSSNAAKG